MALYLPQHLRDEWGKRIKREWFPEHVATRNSLATCDPLREPRQSVGERIRWAKPGTGIYALTYYVLGPRLVVVGDIDDAIYQWSGPVTAEWIAQCGVEYFASKCIASPHGCPWTTWDAETARGRVKERIDEDRDHEVPWVRAFWIDESGTASALRACQTKEEWTRWADDHQYLLGPDWWELIPIGNVIDMQCYAHLIGLQMATT